MAHVLRRHWALLAMLGSVAAICLGLVASESAKASWANYCNPVSLPERWSYCQGTPRALNQVYGWGDQHSVCVGVAGLSSTWRCSAGPGAGVYSAQIGTGTFTPGIQNNAAGANTGHGVSFAP